MLVKYVSHPNATVSSIKSDIVSFLGGNIATANDFGDNCNKTSTIVSGTFPSNTYTVANATALSFSKNHADYANTSYYFRIDITGNNWISVTASNDYDPSTDTFGNSSFTRSYPNNSGYASPIAPQSPTGAITFYMIAGQGMFHMDTPGYSGLAQKSVSLCDISHSSLTREFSNSVLMAGFVSIANCFVTGQQATCPKMPAANGSYLSQVSTGANLTFFSSNLTPPLATAAANGDLFTIETPVFMYTNQSAGNTIHYVYGVNRTSTRSVAPYTIYTDTNNNPKAVLPANAMFSLALDVN